MREYDKTFLHKLQKQDAHAFNIIYDELVDQFFRYIKSNFSLDDATIQDILSDIFIKIWQALPKLDTKASLSWFLWTIAKNHVKDHFKRHDDIPFAHFNTQNDDGENQSWEDGLASADDIIRNSHTSYTFDQIQEAMKSLESSYKDVVRLKYIEEYTHEEIAGTLGISQDAVRQRLSRWLKRLNEMLAHIG